MERKERGDKEEIFNYSITSSVIVYREQGGCADGKLAKGESILLFGRKRHSLDQTIAIYSNARKWDFSFVAEF